MISLLFLLFADVSPPCAIGIRLWSRSTAAIGPPAVPLFLPRRSWRQGQGYPLVVFQEPVAREEEEEEELEVCPLGGGVALEH